MELINWHRLFGLLLTDFFTGSPYVVELEKDLSIKKQLLDVVVVRKTEGEFDEALPDGLENLTTHNLITFKSHHESLDDWALKELTGHYVNYRKQVSPSFDSLLPESEFRLYAVCSRQPHSLMAEVELQPVSDGVYDCRRGTDTIRIVVMRELPEAENNAFLHLLSASVSRVAYGTAHYRQHSPETSTLVKQLFVGYKKEGLSLPYTMADFKHDVALEHIGELTLEERLKGLTPEQRLAGMPPDQRLAGMPPEQRLAGMPPEQRLAGLSPDEIEELFKRVRQSAPDGGPKRKRK